jgi:hypothetical protein
MFWMVWKTIIHWLDGQTWDQNINIKLRDREEEWGNPHFRTEAMGEF